MKLRGVVADLDDLLLSTAKEQAHEDIRVEFSDDTFYSSLGRAILEYCGNRDNCKLSMALEYSPNIIEKIVLRKIDIGVIVSPFFSTYRDVESLDLPEVPMFALVPSGHQLAGRLGVVLDELNESEIIFADMDKNCGFSLKLQSLLTNRDPILPKVKAWPTQLIVELVRDGRGITLLAEAAVPSGLEGVELVRILDEGASLKRSVIWKADPNASVRNLISHLSKLISRGGFSPAMTASH